MVATAAHPEDRNADFTLANHFLIAMPQMADPRFSGTVIYVCEHSPQGALGLVINRPTELTLATLFERVDIDLDSESDATSQDQSQNHSRHPSRSAALLNSPVYAGGPVQTDRGFVLHDPTDTEYGSTLNVDGGLTLTTSRDVLEALAGGTGPGRVLVALGYTGWDEGQLDDEMARNAWLTVPADPNIIFDVPNEARFNAAIGLLGFNPAMLSGEAGHA